MKDQEYPADELIERRLQEVETNDLRADSLEEVITKDEASADATGPLLSGTWIDLKSLTKPVKMVALPNDSEALRHRLSVLQASYTIARTSHPACGWLATATPDIWGQHAKYILGPDVYGFAILHKGAAVKSEWALLLLYEQQVRKKAVDLILYEGLDFGTAMTLARKDQELRNICFVSPATATILTTVTSGALAAMPAPSNPARHEREQRAGPYTKDGGKNKTKGGKGKSKGAASQQQQPWQLQFEAKRVTPDGKSI